MNKYLSAIVVLTLCVMQSIIANDEGRLLRFPTTNGDCIVFSYAGDLYKVPTNGGDAGRITSHPGYEMFPHFSPDGKSIAFTGQYDGNTEVYVVSVDGGEPTRLTYTSTNSRDNLGDRMGPNNIVMGWSNDGKRILYRNRISGSFVGQLFSVSVDGGLPTQLPLPEGGFCSYSPDGKRLAYNRVMREFRTWKYYTGGMADDIWIYEEGKSTVENITNNPSQDIHPMWIGDDIYFLSDRDRTMNLFKYNNKTKSTSKVTNFTEYDIKFPTSNGNDIVFENGGYIYLLNSTTEKAEKVNIKLRSDNVYARSDRKPGANYITAYSLSPDGNRMVLTTRGEVFDVPSEKGVTRNISHTPGAHERRAQWSPDGRYVAYISDATGETELYIQSQDIDSRIQLTKDNDTYIRDFQWSPDSKHIAYTDRENRINLVDITSRSRRVVLTDPVQMPSGVTFSPDSKWLAYTRPANNLFSVIYIYNLSSGKEYPVTDKWYKSFSPRFSDDGRYLVFISEREFNPIYGSKEWNHIYNHEKNIYISLLSKDTPSPFLLKDASVSVKNSSAKEDVLKKEDTVSKEAQNIKIDVENLSERVVAIPVARGYYGDLYSSGKKIYYTRGNSSFLYDLEKQKEELIVEGARMLVEHGRDKALFVKGRNKLYVTPIPASKVTLAKEVDLSNAIITTDYPREWSQIFDEAWRAFRDGFYLKNMHGVDWNKMKKKYEVLLPYVKTRLDLNYVIGEMIAELNCGHAYVNTGELNEPVRVKMGLLGADLSHDSKSGFFKIDEIIPGESWSTTLRSPLTEEGVGVQRGDYIVAIDGVPTSSVKNIYQLLIGKANVPTELMVNGRASLVGARKVVISPLESEYTIRHYQWVQNNLKKVEKASGGKIGYIYIPDMSVEGLKEFTRYFYPQLDKEGLIIDDRFNGGGNISPMLLERLAREPYRLTMYRGSTHTGTVPDAVQVGPKVCLVNKYSASDGDLFPWGFKALGLGKVIGTRTWGGVVGISSSLPFIDGTDVRVPFFTCYDPATGEWIIENEGVTPDIEIDNNPTKEWRGEDEQLNRAIDEVMKDLKNRKKLPGAPKPRVWNGQK